MHAKNAAISQVQANAIYQRREQQRQDLCGRKCVSFLFAMSNIAFAFWGPFQAPSLVSSERPQEADTSICCVYTQKQRIANPYTKVSP